MKPAQPSAAANRLTRDRVGKGIGSIMVAVFLFCMADSLGKHLGERGYAAPQIVFFRFLFGLLPVAVLLMTSGTAALRTRRPWAHALRAGLIFGALVLFFAGLRYIPLAEAIAIAFVAPLFVTAMAAPLLGERVGPRRWLAVLVGFAGALIVLQPGSDAFRPHAIYILASAFCFALAMIHTRHMAKTETNIALFTYTTLGAGLVSVPFLAFVWQPTVLVDLGFFALLGLIGGIAAYLVIIAYRHAPAAVVAPFDYTALIWGSLMGWIVWREAPGLWVWVGAAVIAGSSLYIMKRETKVAKGR